jgi:CO/xanthine dehydrogenase Mo-binding subunit
MFEKPTSLRTGGYGTKGIGEFRMDGQAPAILNTLGIPFNHVPLMPE